MNTANLIHNDKTIQTQQSITPTWKFITSTRTQQPDAREGNSTDRKVHSKKTAVRGGLV